MKSHPKSVLFICLQAIVLLLASCTEKHVARRPNVILINVDDLGWKDLGFMGSHYYETPHLDQFSKEGLVFTNAYAGASNCAPSRACMISGQYGPRHGVYTVSPSDRGDPRTRRVTAVKNEDTLADSLYTLGEMFQDNGYATATIGKWHLSDDPTKMGFDLNVAGNHRGNPGKDGYFSPYKVSNLVNGPEGEYLTDRLTNEAIGFVKHHKEDPFFLYLPFYTVHSPLMGKHDLIDKYKAKSGSDGQEHPVYAAMVEAMDQNVGRLLKVLGELGLEENTMVVFTSDNGGIRKISRQDPLRAGKGSYYEGGIRVPMVIRFPGKIPAGKKVVDPVLQMDLFPTFQSLIQAEKRSSRVDGVDLAPLLFEGKELPQRELYWHFPIYLEAYSPKDDQAQDPLFRTRPGSVIRYGKWKLHEYFEDGSLALYNLEEDLGEKHNVIEKYPEVVIDLCERLKAWRGSTHAPVPIKQNPAFDQAFETMKIKQVMQK
ncbi:sulfatase [Echinicola soli]|uniref:Sulfatase n=1 Tax=Echinicola soli TaxID=2591634 RepID=A0A514CJS0_9BACT|nr:sulfatase [Echinicola soli]QDH80030.1 sulfatase [Echinicola soli]